MINKIPESEIVLNEDGSVYHLNLLPSEVADNVILVGDPDRVKEVSKHFDRVDIKKQKREFVTHCGELAGKKFTVISSGIGTDNIDIVMNELDILVNVDLENRISQKELRKLNVVRIGTSGALQENIPLDSMIVATHGLGLDALMNFYEFNRNIELEKYINEHINYPFLKSYLTTASTEIISLFDDQFIRGVTGTCCGFYAPQGRRIRKDIVSVDIVSKLNTLKIPGIGRVVNFEMETSAIYGLADFFGFNALSVNAVVANRITQKFSKNAKLAVENAIVKTLEMLLK